MAAPFPEAARAGAGIRAPVGARFELQWIASVTTTLQVALLIEHDDGSWDPFLLDDAHAGDRTVELVPIPGGQLQKAGTIRSLTANFADAAGVKRGQAYVIVRMVYAGRTFRLARGYAYDGHPVGLGEDVEPGPGGGEGFITTIGTNNPAAGAEIAVQTVPTNALWRLRSFGITMAQGATQTPRPTLQLRDGSANILVQVDIGATIAANTTVRCHWGLGLGSSGGNNVDSGYLHAPLPDILLPEAFDFITATTGIGAGSDYAAGTYEVEEWLVI